MIYLGMFTCAWGGGGRVRASCLSSSPLGDKSYVTHATPRLLPTERNVGRCSSEVLFLMDYIFGYDSEGPSGSQFFHDGYNHCNVQKPHECKYLSLVASCARCVSRTWPDNWALEVDWVLLLFYSFISHSLRSHH
jgi:hypothetical protein